MQKWEYQILAGYATAELLNTWGEQGWELIAVTFTDCGTPKEFFFKRPKS